MHRLTTRALVVVTLLLSACGSVHVAGGPARDGSQASTPESQSVDPIAPPVTSLGTTGLDRWEGFPVAAQPRPIVFLSGPLHWPDNGFVNDSEKIALSYGGARPTASYPTAPDTAGGYQLIDPASAFRTLVDVPRNGDDTAETIQATAVTLGTSTFATDRGPMDLPAWIFQFDGETAVAVAAVHPKVLFTPLRDHSTSGPAGIPGGGSATLSSDGKTLTVAFTGAAEGQGPCTADYAAVLEERANAVGLSVKTVRQGTGQVEACAAGGFKRTVSATLTSPLADRVLVDSTSGDPIVVTGS